MYSCSAAVSLKRKDAPQATMLDSTSPRRSLSSADIRSGAAASLGSDSIGTEAIVGEAMATLE